MKKKCFAMIFLCVLSFSGCRVQPSPSPRVVSSVTVNWSRDGQHFTRHYTDMQKMEDVLLYLRQAQTGKPPEAQTAIVSHSDYRITVSLMNGQTRIYRQQHHRLFRQEQGPWNVISPELAAEFYALLRRHRSDL